MPAVSGVFETSLYVEDLARSRAFYQELFGFEMIHADERLVAFRVGSRQVFLLFRQGGSVATKIPHDARGHIHAAFAVAADEIEAWERRLRDQGIPVEHIINWRPGVRSVYFRDPDQHLLELATPGVWGVDW